MLNKISILFPRGAFFMILSAGSFCMMTVFVKLAGDSLPTIQIVFVRGLFTLLITGFFLLKAKINPLGKNKRLLTARGLSGTIALFLVYESIQRFPLSEATVIQYLYPLFTAMIAAALILETVDKNILGGLFIGFFGVYAILGFPSLIISPLVCSSSPVKIFNCVVLPEPLEPTNPIFSPLLISQFTFFKTISVEYIFEIPSNLTTA